MYTIDSTSPFAEAFADDEETRFDAMAPDGPDFEADPDPEEEAPTVWRPPLPSSAGGPELERELIDPKNDTRLRVGNTLLPPHRWVCRVTTWWETDRERGRMFGTGILIGPRHMLTAGHNLWRMINGRPTTPKRMKVVPAQDGAREPFGHTMAATSGGEVVAKRPKKYWKQNRQGQTVLNRAMDFALVLLDDELQDRKHKGVRLGYWSTPPHSALERLNPKGMKGQCVTVTGYPNDAVTPRCRQKWEKDTQWEAIGPLTAISSKWWRIAYQVDTTGGQSGGPAWFWKDGVAQLLGVHADSKPKNSGPRVTRTMLRWLTAWAKEWDKGVTREVGELDFATDDEWAA